MRAAFGKTARIEGDDAIRLVQALGHLPHIDLPKRGFSLEAIVITICYAMKLRSKEKIR
jgi:hypothetical protein